jgi:transposase
MVEKRRKFTREFKLEAVRLSEDSELSGAEVARQLGIHRNLLYRWRKQFFEEGQEAFPGQGKLRDSDDEVRRLRRELAELRQERDILKKAVKFFAKESE